MLAEVEQLLTLQDRAQKIRRLQLEIKNLPLERKGLEAQLASSLASLDAMKHKGRELEVARKNLELDAGTRSTSIARLRTQQYETRKNDEFAAIGHEIKRYEEEIRQIEDKELDLMDEAEKLKARIGDEEKKAAAARESVSRQLADLDSKTSTLQTRLDELVQQRDEVAGSLDEDLLDRFNRLFASKGDAAVVALEHEVCTGCHMKVTTATAMSAKAGKEIVSCEQCGRILYYAE